MIASAARPSDLRATDYADACPIATGALEVSSSSEPLERAGRLASGMGAAQWLGPQAMARATMQLLTGRAEAAAATVQETLSALAGSELVFYTDRLYDLGARALADHAALAPGDRDLRMRHEATARTSSNASTA